MANENANQELFARIAELEAMQNELKALKEKTKGLARLKVSQKGAISVYGLQRMPVTLYAGQWEKIIAMVEDGTIQNFINANEAQLTRKAPKAKSSTPATKGSKAKAKKPAADLFPS